MTACQRDCHRTASSRISLWHHLPLIWALWWMFLPDPHSICYFYWEERRDEKFFCNEDFFFILSRWIGKQNGQLHEAYIVIASSCAVGLSLPSQRHGMHVWSITQHPCDFWGCFHLSLGRRSTHHPSDCHSAFHEWLVSDLTPPASARVSPLSPLFLFSWLESPLWEPAGTGSSETLAILRLQPRSWAVAIMSCTEKWATQISLDLLSCPAPCSRGQQGLSG